MGCSKTIKKLLQILIGRARIKSLTTDKEKLYILCSRGIGDTLLFCSFLQEYKKWHREKIVLIVQESHESIVKLYDGYYDEMIVHNKKSVEIMNVAAMSKFGPKKENFKYIIPPSATEYLGYKGLSLLDMFRITLDLDFETSPFFPEMSVTSSNLTKFIEENELIGGKTLLIAPYAYSVPLLSRDVWDTITEKAKLSGYKVVSNIQEGETPLKGTIPFCGSLQEAMEFASYCRVVISLRSGLCDLFAICDLKMLVIYPNEQIRKTFSFENMGLKADIHEICEDEKLTHTIDCFLSIKHSAR